MDSLFAISQMPKGAPVAAMAIGKAGAVNAAVLAAQIIALSDDALKERLSSYRKKQSESVIKEDLKLQKSGIKEYLSALAD
jgi:phosphoribosylaminoimidazole carboxylase PurE protein